MSNDQASETTPAPVPDPVRRGALRRPRAPALIGPAGRAFSYGALEAAVERGTERLATAGVGEGDRVACLLPREPAYVVLLMALWRRRAVAAPLPARIPPAGRVRLLEAIGARTLVAADPAATDAPERVRVLAVPDLVGGLPGDVDDERAPPNESVRRPADQPATLVFTSGSTGAPKAALHTTGNHWFSADGSRRNLPLAPSDRWLLSLPLYHVGGLAVVLRCLWAGATVAFPREDEPLAPALRRTGATHASLVAAQLRRLLEAAPHDDAGTGVPASMTALLLGGGPAPPTLIEAAHRAGWPVAVSYGLTEMASQVATTAPGDPLDALLHTAGRPLAHRRVRIRGGPDGEASREGDIGEILVHGRTRFAGYVTGGGRLREPFTRAFGEDGWFATGDLGRFDAEGRLRVTGRRDRRFVSGGENVQPEEIEAALRRRPGVAEAAVVPVPHEAFGRRPVAFVRGTQGAPVSPEEDADDLRAALRERLPGYKVPDAFYPWPEDAASAGLKPDRALLKRRARERFGGEGGRGSKSGVAS